jgi:glycerate 2-kinase
MDIARLRQDAIAILKHGIKSVDPANAIKRDLVVENNRLDIQGKVYDLSAYENIFIIGAGKASAAMAKAIEDLLGDRIKGGIVNVKYGHTAPLKIVRANEAGHPVPDEAGLAGTNQILQLLRQTGQRDLVFCLISGGGSALLPCPAEGITLEDKQRLTKALLDCGATIHEINSLRKQVSKVKGGRLAQLVYPSTLVSLILSDVIGDDLDSIASGPTVPDNTTFTDCLNILERHKIHGQIPSSILQYVEKGCRGEVRETPKADDPVFKRTQNVIIGSNKQALSAAKEQADKLGYNSLILSSFIEGETTEVAKVHAAIAKEILSTGNPVGRPACVVSGGETTVKIKGSGLGGRNQEFALAAAISIDGLEGVLILSAGTDGTDGPTEAAGAIADGSSIRRSKELGMVAEKYLRDNNSYNFFKPLRDLVITGPTNTNVMDLRIIMVS